jgi:hypothetical protein
MTAARHSFIIRAGGSRRENLMFRKHTLIALGAAVFAAAACSDAPPPTAPSATPSALSSGPSQARPAVANPFANIPILSSTGTLLGNLTLTSFDIVNGVLVASGSFTYLATGITTTVTNLPVSLISSGAGAACQILNLDIGAIDLNLLGLGVALAPVSLDIVATPGPGQLLGNLLCAVAHLLDQGGPLSNALTSLLNTINGILGGLL